MTTRHKESRLRDPSGVTINGQAYVLRYATKDAPWRPVTEGRILSRGTIFTPPDILQGKEEVKRNPLDPVVGGIQITHGEEIRALVEEFRRDNPSAKGIELVFSAVEFVRARINNVGSDSCYPELYTTDQIVAEGKDTDAGIAAVLATLLKLSTQTSHRVFSVRGSRKIKMHLVPGAWKRIDIDYVRNLHGSLEGGITPITWVEIEVGGKWHMIDPTIQATGSFYSLLRNQSVVRYESGPSEALRPVQ